MVDGSASPKPVQGFRRAAVPLTLVLVRFHLQIPDSLSFMSFLLPSQDIIPQPLLDEYVSMTDPARAQTVDADIAKHCAYSLPGVALALGRQNWHCLKDTYETLASDVQVKGAFSEAHVKVGWVWGLI